jgi:hypothetical protein
LIATAIIAGVAGQRGAYRVGVEVIRVLVGDQDRGGAGQGNGRVGEHARVDDQGGAYSSLTDE